MVSLTYLARFWAPLWHSSGYRAIAGYGWKPKLCSLFFSLFFQVDTPKHCAWRENNLPCMFTCSLPETAVAQKTGAPVIFLFGKGWAGKAHALIPDGTGSLVHGKWW